MDYKRSPIALVGRRIKSLDKGSITMSGSMKDTPSLAPAEWEVMKILWDHGPLAARDVFANLPDKQGWAYKTVKTLLSRLVAKQALAYDQVGNSYLYRAAVDRESVTKLEVQSIFQRMVSEAFAPVLTQFIEAADLSEAEIKQLKRLLDEKRQSNRQ